MRRFFFFFFLCFFVLWFFFFNDTATTEIYTLSLHDALPILNRFMLFLQAQRHDGREYIVCGDWNIAHKEIDLKNWKSNQKNSGFLPEERAWLTKLFDEVGYVDVFRNINQEENQYTWWSNRGQAWAKNVGWRLDYQITTPEIAKTAKSESIYKDERFSDHSPLIIDYDYELG